MVKSESMLGPSKPTSREGNIFFIRDMKMQEICDLKYLSTSEHHGADQPKTCCTSAGPPPSFTTLNSNRAMTDLLLSEPLTFRLVCCVILAYTHFCSWP